MAGVEAELAALSAQKEESRVKLVVAEKKLMRRGTLSNLHVACGAASGTNSQHPTPLQPGQPGQAAGGSAGGDGSLHGPPTMRALSLRHAADEKSDDAQKAGRSLSRVRAVGGGMRRALSFDRDRSSRKANGQQTREAALAPS